MAVKVTDILQQILTDQARRTISGSDAVRRILEETRRQVIVELSTAPADGFAAWQLPQTLNAIGKHLGAFESAAKTEVAAGLTESWEAGVQMLPGMLKAAGIQTISYGIPTAVLDQLKEFSWGKISSVTTDALAKIRSELTLGLLGQKTPHEITQAVTALIENSEQPAFKSGRSIFQSVSERAEVITKVELGRTFSMANQKSMEAAADDLPELQKMWLHTGHPRTPRIYHLALNGSIKPVDQPFLVGNIAMMHPRDPKAPVSEIINCGCMHVPYMAAWGKKEEFIKSWEKAQKAANTKKER
ncbi:MAG: hypothetical protein H7Y05_14995 [Steroidobacteraceae bacterium]|nr:hypothetical protein [Deltaproteobacteria bacterium]